MFFDTFWALVLGFVLSGFVQGLISRERMQQILGDHKPKSIAKAGFYGMVSSSCSYAASALARSIFVKGGDFTAAMVFMFASTNLVIELGIVLWFLIGWQFALAEFIGGAVMIVLIALLIPRLFSSTEIERARLLSGGESGVQPVEAESEIGKSIELRKKITAAAGYTIGDFKMLRVELVIGFVVAGLATSLIPFSLWRSLFLSGHGFWSVLENSVLGPFLAFISFVCSVGNVPLAAALWSAGITFGGVIAFIFADLVAFPLVMIYRKYYGNRFALKLVFVFWGIMSLSGMATEGLFKIFSITPQRVSLMQMSSNHAGWNVTTVLNGVAAIVLAGTISLYRSRDKDGESEFAEDPICGMQVRKSDAPASATIGGKEYYFCMDGCKVSFLAKHH
jgi:hypothetical protein